MRMYLEVLKPRSEFENLKETPKHLVTNINNNQQDGSFILIRYLNQN